MFKSRSTSTLINNLIRITCFLGLLSIGLIGFWIFAPDWLVFYSEERQGNIIVKEIEDFKRQQGRLPKSMEYDRILKKLSLYTENESCPCYSQKNSSSYSVWYQGKSLGQSFIYHSDTQEWGLDGG